MQFQCKILYTVSQKNDTDVAHSNYDIHEEVLIMLLTSDHQDEEGFWSPCVA